MASAAQGAIPRAFQSLSGRNGLLDRYFYFAMSLLVAGIVVWGFSHSVNENLFHPAVPRPFFLWIHAAAFSGWVAFYMFQSALVRTRNVKWHRFFGWFGVGLASVMVVLGFTIAVIMNRFEAVVLHEPDPAFLAIPFSDMVFFGVLVALAIYWRRKPELHRRLLFIATCALLDAPFARISFLFNNNLFYPCIDAVMLLGVVRDLMVNRRIHKVYLIALPALMTLQVGVLYLWRGSPGWWLRITQAILG
jgi:FtsH-binding integral membrane protein